MTGHLCKQRITDLTLVVAMTAEGVIGAGGDLPWDLPEDLHLFRQLTLGGTVVMGRKTFESLPAPLEGRHNLIVGRPRKKSSHDEFHPSPAAAIDRARQLNRPVFIIGGRDLYLATLPMCNQLVVSWVEQPVTGDTYFPEIDWSDWELRSEEDYTGFRRCFYRRREPGL